MTQTVLVIDDEDTIRDNIAELLEQEQFSVIQAETGQQGIEQASNQLPHLIICDVMMPDIDGFRVLETLRQTPETSLIPFIFLTVKDSHQHYREGMELGADDYLFKPFNNEELIRAIYTRLEKQSNLLERSPLDNHQLKSLRSTLSELQRTREMEKDLFSNFAQDLRSSLSKVNLAIDLLKQEPDQTKRERYLQVLKEECHWEMELLNKVEELQTLLTPENINFLQRYNLLGNYKQIQ